MVRHRLGECQPSCPTMRGKIQGHRPIQRMPNKRYSFELHESFKSEFFNVLGCPPMLIPRNGPGNRKSIEQIMFGNVSKPQVFGKRLHNGLNTVPTGFRNVYKNKIVLKREHGEFRRLASLFHGGTCHAPETFLGSVTAVDLRAASCAAFGAANLGFNVMLAFPPSKSCFGYCALKRGCTAAQRSILSSRPSRPMAAGSPSIGATTP